MKQIALLTGAAAAVVMISGCRPDLNQGQYGAEEQQWQDIIRSNYSGYRPPRIAPSATIDRATPEALEKQQGQQEQQNSQQDADPGKETVSEVTTAAEVDAAADNVQKAPAADDKKAESDKKAEDKANPADDKKAPAADDKKAEPAANADCVIHTVAPGETLGSIARKYYGKASLFEIIVKANPQLKDPKHLRIGTKLSIPKL